MSVTYKFDTQHAIGKEHEARLDAFFSRWFNITHATPEQQRRGIDRVFVAKAYPFMVSHVEYKADVKASLTGNLFIEILSNDSKKLPGWGVKCDAQWVVVYVPDEGEIYILGTGLLHLLVPIWLMKWEIGKVPNDGYRTHGIKVPRKVVQASNACLEVLDIKGKYRELGEQHKFC